MRDCPRDFYFFCNQNLLEPLRNIFRQIDSLRLQTLVWFLLLQRRDRDFVSIMSPQHTRVFVLVHGD